MAAVTRRLTRRRRMVVQKCDGVARSVATPLVPESRHVGPTGPNLVAQITGRQLSSLGMATTSFVLTPFDSAKFCLRRCPGGPRFSREVGRPGGHTKVESPSLAHAMVGRGVSRGANEHATAINKPR